MHSSALFDGVKVAAQRASLARRPVKVSPWILATSCWRANSRLEPSAPVMEAIAPHGLPENPSLATKIVSDRTTCVRQSIRERVPVNLEVCKQYRGGPAHPVNYGSGFPVHFPEFPM